MLNRTYEQPSWRRYQSSLQKESAAREKKKKIIKRIVFFTIFVFFFRGAQIIIPKIADPFQDFLNRSHETRKKPEDALLGKKDIQAILGSRDLINLTEKTFTVVSTGREFHVRTSLDINLQSSLLETIDYVSKLKRGRPRHLGIVAIDPATGRVLAMTGYDDRQQIKNLCVDGKFPAASIFKIITASAAIEKCGITPGTRFKYNGGKYTLYKSQLKERTNKYTNRITLRDSFAQSVNPVFGKIGSIYLQKSALIQYADAFGFNRDINFEVPTTRSSISIEDDAPYQWAEIASGFNRDTLLSPLHGAMLSSAILNRGRIMEPTAIDSVTDDQNRTVYRHKDTLFSQAISPETAGTMKNMMTATIKSGTSRKAFRGYKRDKILKQLLLGGKTGSIYNKARDVRYDWFVGFAQDKKSSQGFAISVVVGHQKYIGRKSSQYAKQAMKTFYRDYFAQKSKDTAPIQAVSVKTN